MLNARAVVLDGASRPVRETRFLAAALLGEDAPAGELAYVFCGNGTCRDCNLLVEGLEDIPSCRMPLASGLSLRSGEGAGDGNALSRRLGRPAPGAPMRADVAIVGAGASGRAAAAQVRSTGLEPLVLEARASTLDGVTSPAPVAILDGRPVVFEAGRARPLRARALVLATGSRDAFPPFPGSVLPGVLPLDLLERYLDLGATPGRRFVLASGGPRARRVQARLEAAGADTVEILSERRVLASVAGELRVESVRLATGRRLEADVVAVSFRREPALALAKALGCRVLYDRAAGCDRLVLGVDGATSVPGVFAASPGSRAGAAAARSVLD